MVEPLSLNFRGFTVKLVDQTGFGPKISKLYSNSNFLMLQRRRHCFHGNNRREPADVIPEESGSQCLRSFCDVTGIRRDGVETGRRQETAGTQKLPRR